MENPFRRRVEDAAKPILTPTEKIAVMLRNSGERAQIADLGASSAGINLNLTDSGRMELLAELEPAIKALGFK